MTDLYCKCGKHASKILDFPFFQIAIHITTWKTYYWHIYYKDTGIIKRVNKKPNLWE